MAVLSGLLLSTAAVLKPGRAEALVGCGITVCIPVAKWPEVTDWVARNGAAAIPGQATDAATGLPSCHNVCDDLFLSEHRPMPGQIKSKDMHKELGRLERSTGMWPKVGKALGDIGLAFTSFDIGMTIGTGINTKFLRFGLDGPEYDLMPDGDPYGWKWLDTDQFGLSYLAAGQPLQSLGGVRQVDPSAALPFDALIVTDIEPRLQDNTIRKVQFDAADESLASGNCMQRSMVPSTPGGEVHLWAIPTGTGQGFCFYRETYTCGVFSCTRDHTFPEIPSVYYVEPEELQTQAPKDYDPDEDGVPTTSVPTWTGQPADRSALAQRVQTELEDNASEYPNLREFIGTTIAEPPGKIDVPDCHGVTLAECLKLLEEQGFAGTHHTVRLEPSEADVSIPPSTVVDTDPYRGESVDADGVVTIERNPLPGDMPTRVPQIRPGDDREQVAADLNAADLEADFTVAPSPDPTVGPDEVTRTPVEPMPGSEAARGTPVEVEVNPSDAPGEGGGPGGGGIDLSPLNVITPCTKFPFGVPCYINDVLGGWDTSAHAPAFDVSIPYFDKNWHVDLSILNPVLVVFRPVLLLASVLGLALLFMRLSGGFGGASSDD